MPALAELEQAWIAAREDPATAPSWTSCCATSAGARRRSTARGACPSARAGSVYLKREDLNHTGSHKLNNALGPGAAGQADGQAADHRRDGRGPARRRDGDRLRAAGPGVRRLHGRRGHAPPAPERAAHGTARRDRPAGRRGREDAEGGDLGGDPRLGDERGEHPLRDRLGRRPGALSGARARPAARDRRRGARADPRARGSAAGAGDRVRRRRLERDRHLRRVHPRRGRRADRRRGRRRGHRHATPRRAADGRRARRASCTARARR